MAEMREIPVSGLYPLYGTLEIPDNTSGTTPLIVLLGNNAPADRNGVQGQPYARLSKALNRQGWPTYRFDKRGTGKSGGDYWETGFWETVDDAQMVLATLREDKQLNKRPLILLGHQEGALTAVALSNRQPPDGLILLGFNIENPETQLRRKHKEEPEPSRNLFQRTIAFFQRPSRRKSKFENQLLKIKKSKRNKMMLGLEWCNAGWLRETFLYNSDEAINALSCPVLTIAPVGELGEHARKSAELAGEQAVWRVIHHLNINTLNRQPAAVAEDEAPSEIHPDLVNTISNWLNEIKNDRK